MDLNRNQFKMIKNNRKSNAETKNKVCLSNVIMAMVMSLKKYT